MVANQVSSNRLFHKAGSSCLTRRSAVSASPHHKKKARYPITPEQRVLAARLRQARRGDPVFLEIENRLYREVTEAGVMIDRSLFYFWGIGRRKKIPGWVRKILRDNKNCAGLFDEKPNSPKKEPIHTVIGNVDPVGVHKKRLAQFQDRKAKQSIQQTRPFFRLFCSLHETAHLIDFSKDLTCSWKETPYYKKNDFTARLFQNRAERLADATALIKLADMIGVPNVRKFMACEMASIAFSLTSSPVHDTISCMDKAIGWYEKALEKGHLQRGQVSLVEAAKLVATHHKNHHRKKRFYREFVATDTLCKLSRSSRRTDAAKDALLARLRVPSFQKPQIVALTLNKALYTQAVYAKAAGSPHPDLLQNTVAYLKKQKALTP